MDVLHHQKRPIAVEVEVVDPDQVGMLQIDQQPALRDQAGPGLQCRTGRRLSLSTRSLPSLM